MKTDYEDIRYLKQDTLQCLFLDDEMVDDGVSLFASHSSSLQSRFSFLKCPPIVLKVIGVDKRQDFWYQALHSYKTSFLTAYSIWKLWIPLGWIYKEY